MFSLMYDEEEAIRVKIEEEKEEIAERSLKMGLTVEQVVQITELSEEEVMKIKEHLEI